MSGVFETVQDSREARLMQAISGFFDSVWYANRYPDIVAAGMEPLLHFIRHGIDERRDPNRFFDGAWYTEHYPDVAASGQHPLLHYLQSGAAELRNPHPRFDAAWYVEQHPEAAANPISWHMRFGLVQGYPTERPVYIRDYLPSAEQPLPPPKGVSVDVIIPVYKGLKETRACLDSVLADRRRPKGKVIVVDDCSPEAALVTYLDRLSASGRIDLRRNRRNLGFVKSVNAGIDAASGDVVLLNSDTRVPDGWLARLSAHAHADPRVATVSPLSNNATICGYPNDAGGPIAFGAALADVDAACQAVNAGRFVETPTTVGFCMYIRRDALSQTGPFDAKTFGLGYGEENDFCQRAIALGWTHRIACDVFVYHKGSVSFGDRAEARAKQAMLRLRERYPDYPRDVAVHVSRDAIGPHRFALTGELMRRSGLPVILMVSHELGGGVQRHIDALVQRLDAKAHILLLRASARGAALTVPALTGHPALQLQAERLDDLIKVLRHCNVGRVHVHHLMGMDVDVRLLVHRLNLPFDITVHDYYAICPQVNLLPAPTGLYCGEPDASGCNACIAERPAHGARDILSWRAERAWQFHEADRVLCPSADVLARLERHGLAGRAVLAPHEAVTATAWPEPQPVAAGRKLRIAVLGVLADHKGARTVASVAEMADPRQIEIHLIGYTEASFPEAALPRLHVTGQYDDDELPALIRSVDPHVIWFPAVWPETFSYTLSVAIDSGRPIAATRIGAFTERLAGRALTWMAGHATSPRQWLDLFETIRRDRARQPATEPAPRPLAADFYAGQYLRPAKRERPVYPVRLPGKPVIVVVPERYDTSGPTPCAYIRLLQPLTHPSIAADFDLVLADTKTVFNYRPAIIVTQRYAIPDLKTADRLKAHARATQATLLYDIDDDLLHIAPTHPEAAVLRPLAKVVRRMLAHADVAWASTPLLAQSLASVRPDIAVVPNGLDERIWLAPRLTGARAHEAARILCMGTTTHNQDFALVAPALARLKEEFAGSVEIDVLGMTNDPLPAGLNRIGPSHIGTQSYPGFVHWLSSQLRGWDIGLAPLLETPFNLCKSSIKAMDYAALGMAVLASDMPVYQGSLADGPAGQLVPNDPRAWYSALNWLIRDGGLRRSMAAGSRAAFCEQASLASQADARRERLRSLIEAPARARDKRRARLPAPGAAALA